MWKSSLVWCVYIYKYKYTFKYILHTGYTQVSVQALVLLDRTSKDNQKANEVMCWNHMLDSSAGVRYNRS